MSEIVKPEAVMSIVQQTTTTTKRSVQPVLTWMFSSILGGVFAASGIFTIILFGQPAVLTCVRTAPTQGNCKLATSGFFSREDREIPLNEFEGAKVNDDTDLVMLLTDSQEISFTPYSIADDNEQQAIATRINNFVKNPKETSLTIHKDDCKWFHYAFGGSLIAAGLYFGVYRSGRKQAAR